MLRQLSISNVALIDQLVIAFEDGFSVLTGETGAGKSIIIEAFNFVLGERASRELIQSGKQKASVEALFELGQDEPVRNVLEELALDSEEDTLALYRELSDNGKGLCRVNGMLVSVAILKQIGDALVDIHGQHAHQSLLNPKLHIQMLDAFAGEKITAAKELVQAAYRRASVAGKALSSAETDERERERRIDLLSYQIREIDGANLEDGEDESLNQQRRTLQNAQAIMQALETASEVLNGEDNVLQRLSLAVHAMEGVGEFQKEYADAADRLRDLYYNLEDAAYTVRDLRGEFTFEPDTLNQIEWRLEAISTLKKKYGATIGEVLAYRERIGQEHEALQTYEERQEALAAEYAQALAEYTTLAQDLSALRKAAGEALSAKLLPELADLGMPRAQFEVAFTRLEGDLPGANGIDGVEFLLSTNAGEPVKALSKVASGGEISRIMLSFKSVLADTDRIATMVFDEIDSGISGQIGTAVAQKMRQIARAHQVLCITHLPQIAAYANRQYQVFKIAQGDKTRSSAVLLDEEQRAAEIARIMGGTPEDGAAMEHARRLIAQADADMAR